MFTADVGTPTIWAARYLAMNGRRRLIGSWVHGSMANAMAHAIGAQASQKGRQVISMSGDGGFAMLMGDLITLTQMKLPVKVVIFNNGVLGFVAMEMKASGFIETGVDLQNPDFAAMARAMGIHAVRVEDPGELSNAIRDVLAHDGPAVLDVVTATQELSMPPTITAEQIKGFSLWVLRAVMSGRGDAVIDVAKTNLLSRSHRSDRLPQALIHHEAARDGELAQGARNELLRPVQIAPGRHLEIPDRAEVVFERRQQSGQADRRMRAVVERQQQQFQMRRRTVFRRCGDAGNRRQHFFGDVVDDVLDLAAAVRGKQRRRSSLSFRSRPSRAQTRVPATRNG